MTDTSAWHRDAGWPCPCHGLPFNSVEQMGIHVSKHERDEQAALDWEGRLNAPKQEEHHGRPG